MTQTPQPPPADPPLPARAAAPSSPLLALVQFLLRMVGAGAMGLANVLLHLVLLMVLTAGLLQAWIAWGTTRYDGPTGAAKAAQQQFRVVGPTANGPSVVAYRPGATPTEPGQRATELPLPSTDAPSTLKLPTNPDHLLQRDADGSYALTVVTTWRTDVYRYGVTAGVAEPIAWRHSSAGMALGAFALSLLLLWGLRKGVARLWPNARLLR